MDKFDLIVLGGGPGGYLAAERAAHGKLKTLVVEKRAFGGVCLNEGCIPSKSLLYSAKVYDYTKHSERYGVKCEGSSIDQKAVVARKNKVVKTLVSGVRGALKANGAVMAEGVGKICGREGSDYVVEVDGKKYLGARLLIATGSMPMIPPVKGLDEAIKSGFALTNREILDLEEIPGSLVIVGGGVIGLEMASYYNSVGSQVTIIEMLDHIAGNTDADISKILMNNYKKKGISFQLSSKVVEFTKDSVVYEHDGKTVTVPADRVLVSIGRRPVTQDIGLETIGVETERGYIKTDRNGLTNIPNVYAAGDVNGKIMLAHTAYREAEVCVNHMLGKKDVMRYEAIPSVIYTNPEVGSVGETEESAKQKGIDYKVSSITMKYSGRYVAENEGGEADGICKVLVEKKYNRIIGVHMIGNYASEIIWGAGLIVEAQMTVDDIKELVFPHPTVSEIIREAIFQL